MHLLERCTSATSLDDSSLSLAYCAKLKYHLPKLLTSAPFSNPSLLGPKDVHLYLIFHSSTEIRMTDKTLQEKLSVVD
jgi:hypothetical protein